MFLGLNITKSSYALFSTSIKGEKSIEVEVDNLINKTTVFNYTGDSQEYEVPKDGYYYIELGGASGGYIDDIYNSGLGAKTSGYIYLEKGEVLYFYIGGKGTLTKTANTIISGGYNGGGDAKTESASDSTATTGGGATDVRLVGGSWDNMSSLISRIMVAAGGAGSNNNTTYIGYGGAGGTLHGLSGESNQGDYYGTGGTQISGGVCMREDSPPINGEFGIGSGFTISMISSNAGAGGGGCIYYDRCDKGTDRGQRTGSDIRQHVRLLCYIVRQYHVSQRLGRAQHNTVFGSKGKHHQRGLPQGISGAKHNVRADFFDAQKHDADLLVFGRFKDTAGAPEIL